MHNFSSPNLPADGTTLKMPRNKNVVCDKLHVEADMLT